MGVGNTNTRSGSLVMMMNGVIPISTCSFPFLCVLPLGATEPLKWSLVYDVSCLVKDGVPSSQVSFPSWCLNCTLKRPRNCSITSGASALSDKTSGSHGHVPSIPPSLLSLGLLHCSMGSCVSGSSAVKPCMIIVLKSSKQEREDPYLEHVSVPVKINNCHVEWKGCKVDKLPSSGWLSLRDGYCMRGSPCGLCSTQVKHSASSVARQPW